MSEEAPAQLREALEARDKALKEAQAELTKLQSEHRQLQASSIFEKAKLSPKHAELFLLKNPEGDITAEAVQTFAKEYNLAAEEGQQTPPGTGKKPEAKPSDAPLAGMSGAGQQPGQGGSSPASQVKLSQVEWDKLLRDNPSEAVQAYMEGRAPTVEGNVMHERLVERGIVRS